MYVPNYVQKFSSVNMSVAFELFFFMLFSVSVCNLNKIAQQAITITTVASCTALL